MSEEQKAEQPEQNQAEWNTELDALAGYLRTRGLTSHEIVAVLAGAIGIVIWSNSRTEVERLRDLIDAVTISRQTMDEFEESGQSKDVTLH